MGLVWLHFDELKQAAGNSFKESSRELFSGISSDRDLDSRGTV
ncbi:MAG: hypothetical protein QNJ38_04870 [Prochloraceae cyanobacterium]|nr:hypothetical protein [Prochloraceae cyanobacterium]